MYSNNADQLQKTIHEESKRQDVTQIQTESNVDQLTDDQICEKLKLLDTLLSQRQSTQIESSIPFGEPDPFLYPSNSNNLFQAQTETKNHSSDETQIKSINYNNSIESQSLSIPQNSQLAESKMTDDQKPFQQDQNPAKKAQDERLEKLEKAKLYHWKFQPKFGHEMVNDQSFKVPRTLFYLNQVQDVNHDSLSGLLQVCKKLDALYFQGSPFIFKVHGVYWHPTWKYINIGCRVKGCDFRVNHRFTLDEKGKPWFINQVQISSQCHSLMAHQQTTVKDKNEAQKKDFRV